MLTETTLHQKRHSRTLARRRRARSRCSFYGQLAELESKRLKMYRSTVVSTAKMEQEQREAREVARKQAQESRRTNQAMSGHAKIGLIDRVKSFFQRRGR